MFCVYAYNLNFDWNYQIAVLCKGDPVPVGYEVVPTPLSCETLADDTVVPLRRLAVKRSPSDAFAYSYGYAFVDDVCVVNLSQGEVPPEQFRTIDQLLSEQHRGTSGDKVMLSYHYRGALGICNVPLEAATLDRYPQQVPPPAPCPPFMTLSRHICCFLNICVGSRWLGATSGGAPSLRLSS